MAGDAKRRWWRKIGINFIAGALAGALAAMVLGNWLDSLEMSDAHIGGLIIGVVLVSISLTMFWAATSPVRAAKMMGQALEPGEDFSSETKSLRLQAVVGLMAGAELLVLSWRTDVLTGPAKELLLAGLLLLLLAQTWLNWRLWRTGDEFFRRLLVESCVIAFVAGQFLVFAWAAASRFGYANHPTALDIYVLLMALYLIAGSWAGTRRGLGVPER